MADALTATHRWVSAAAIAVTENVAAQADRRGTFRVAERTKVVSLEVYCDQCRKPYKRVAGSDCEAFESRDHLIGGPTGERKKRADEAEHGGIAATG